MRSEQFRPRRKRPAVSGLGGQRDAVAVHRRADGGEIGSLVQGASGAKATEVAEEGEHRTIDQHGHAGGPVGPSLL